jgi:hypothetical protein
MNANSQFHFGQTVKYHANPLPDPNAVDGVVQDARLIGTVAGWDASGGTCADRVREW